MTVWLVRIWTYKNADEKAHTLSRRSKNVKKRTKTYEKRILCKFTLRMGKFTVDPFMVVIKWPGGSSGKASRAGGRR